ncbi:MAG TPA: ribbon-helix-helix domain-containing protein [Candidatus Bipolaricaulota bacterium]
MALKSVQVRLTEQQLKTIDQKVKKGDYPSRSEAIRDYVRRAELFELFNRFFAMMEEKPVSEQDLERVRQRVWDKKYAQRVKAKAS